MTTSDEFIVIYWEHRVRFGEKLREEDDFHTICRQIEELYASYTCKYRVVLVVYHVMCDYGCHFA